MAFKRRLNSILKKKNKPYSKCKVHRRKKTKIIIAIVASIIIVLFAFLYLPQFFIPHSNDGVCLTVKPINFDINQFSDNDFDNDGITNRQEKENGTNPYYIDSDRNGISDLAELNLNETDLSALYPGELSSAPFSVNGVILWADDDFSQMTGSVAYTAFGCYEFTNFRGWAKFPTGNYAYKYKEGIHTLLKYRDKENAYYIDENCVVEITDEKLETVYLVSFFGKEEYKEDSWWQGFLDTILPEKGFITSRKMTLKDTYQNLSQDYYCRNTNIDWVLSQDRFMTNTNSLSDLTDVLYSLKAGKCVLVSLYSQEKGESLGIIYNYNINNEFEVIDYFDNSIVSTIHIQINTSKYMDENKKMKPINIFEFKSGCFDSEDGDCISFILQ